MIDLSRTMILSFEIIDDCNLKHCHTKCPISVKKKQNANIKRRLNVHKIIQCMQEAQKLNFNGYVAFHLYNEPLLAKNEIIYILEKFPDFKYLLWTNGLLLDKVVEKNEFIKKFDLVNISCYDMSNLPFFEAISRFHGRVHIFCNELDDRLCAYTREHTNYIGCKRPVFELPIDNYGNVLLCCNDWENHYKLGNIFDSSLIDIVLSEKYQTLLESTRYRLLDLKTCPSVCRKCNNPMVVYKRYLELYS